MLYCTCSCLISLSIRSFQITPSRQTHFFSKSQYQVQHQLTLTFSPGAVAESPISQQHPSPTLLTQMASPTPSISPFISPSACQSLNATACAATCLPFNLGKPSQAHFSCNDWWHQSHCCKQSQTHTVVTTIYHSCICQSSSFTTSGLAVILALVVLSIAACSMAAYYFLAVRRRKINARGHAHDRALGESELYLPR